MAGWFDSYARKSAERTENVRIGRTSGVSRRRFVVGGSAAVATAWTAPMLLSSPAYAGVGASACPPNSVFCGTDASGTTAVCCAPGDQCFPTSGNGGGAACQNELGGPCSNEGQGTCNAPYHCNSAANHNAINQCNGCGRQNKCGGEGATCGDNSQCEDLNIDPAVQGSVCSDANRTTTFKYCRKTCSSNGDCNVNAGQFCDQVTHLCALHCTAANASQVCQNPGTCGTGAIDTAKPTDHSICMYTAQS